MRIWTAGRIRLSGWKWKTTLRHALREIIACFPVYRSYIAETGVSEADRKYVETALRRAAARNPIYGRSLFQFVRSMLLLEYPAHANAVAQAEQRRFVGKFQQVTAPVMAKGVEDTAFYVYNRLLSLNEVGGEPARFGAGPAAVHRGIQSRHERWPWSLSPLSTHDTKRSEDVRARLNVLSEIPARWRASVERWHALNAAHKVQVEDEPAPDTNEEYLLYQTLIGAWPLEPYTAQDYAAFVERIQQYINKVLHEAKVHSSWLNPNEPYDQAVREFVARILDQDVSKAFLDDMRPFRQEMSRVGLLYSLGQTLLRLTLPGVADTYQGTELWDFSLVDPDNRRPVDYEVRQRMLVDLKRQAAEADGSSLIRSLLRTIEDGRLKLFLTWQGLTCRRDHPGLFSIGEYQSVDLAGPAAEHAFAFLRRHGGMEALVVVPRLLMRLLPSGFALPLPPHLWSNTRLILRGASRKFRDVFTGLSIGVESDGLDLAAALRVLPIALLLSEPA